MATDKDFLGQNFSYSVLADVYAVATEAGEAGCKEAQMKLIAFALDLERAGVASLEGKGYILREQKFGQEIVSEDDLETEGEKGDEEW